MRIRIFMGLWGLFPLGVEAANLVGDRLAIGWGLPFVGLLLSIAAFPLLIPGFWHRHFGKVTLIWALAFLLPYAASVGMDAAFRSLVHALVADFFPFLILIAALFVIAGGIYVRGNLHGTPLLNTGLLALGTVLASIMGTTGASMLMIRPMIRANDHRRHMTHIMVFFIFLVGNAGGALTPLGDPPLFLGFLKGIDFFWTTRHLFRETLLLCLMLLIIFYSVDHYYYRQPGDVFPPQQDPTPDAAIQIEGKWNFLLLAVVIGLVLMSGLWKSHCVFSIWGTSIALENLLRDGLLIGVMAMSWWITPQRVRMDNNFSWGAIQEVGQLFAGIFITIIPVIAMLRAGEQGAFSTIVRMVTDLSGQPNPVMYFWATGVLSSFLDNAPTYLVFFNTAGGDPTKLMTQTATTLAAISCGAVFMGANTYLGNAPNLMIKAIAEERGVKMPSFLGYMVWSGLVLVPLFIAMSFIFFR